LIPVLRGNEYDPEFLEKICENADRIIVLVIINQEEIGNIPSGFVSSRIKELEHVGERITEFLKRKGVDTKMELEWGNPELLINEYVKKEKLDKVYWRGEYD
jgi:hypothetical protein